MSFRLSHKAVTTIRSTHRSWLTTTHSCIQNEVQNDIRARTSHFSLNPQRSHTKLPPSTQPRRQTQYQSVCIQLHLSLSYSAYNKSTDVTSPCMWPCAGINRKICQPWCIARKLLQKQASLPACQSLYPTAIYDQGMWSALHHSWVSFAPLQSTVVIYSIYYLLLRLATQNS
jgi:hypothetical protein